MADRKVYQIKMDKDNKYAELDKWFKGTLLPEVKKRGIDPFMFIGFADANTSMRPLGMFWGNNLGDYLMTIAEACEMLSRMYTKADSFDVLEGVKAVLEIRDKTQKTKIPCTEQEVYAKLDSIIDKFGDVAEDSEEVKNA